MTADGSLEVRRCETCQSRYLPTDGPCPQCGGLASLPLAVPPRGSVLAATELQYPAAGWTAPHPIALVEVAEGVRLLGIVEGPLPATGELVEVRRDGEVYRVRAAPRERGEGDSPKAGSAAPSFEPPR